MRIAVVHNLRRGGAARRVATTIDYMPLGQGDEVREFLLSSGEELTANGVSNGLRSCHRQRVCQWSDNAPRPLRPPLRYLDHVQLSTAWARLAHAIDIWAPDVVFANPCNDLVGAPAALSSLHSPIVYYCDEPRRVDYEAAAVASRSSRTQRLYSRLYEAQRRSDRAGIGAADVLLTNSDFSAHRIRAAYGKEAVVIEPGVAPAFSTAAEGALGGYLLSVGSLIPSKGHDLAVAAVAKSAVHMPLVVVAPRAVPAEAERLAKLAHEGGVALSIRTAIPDRALVDAYRGAVATLFLARDEPLGLASLEAQACGTPVVVADEGGLAGTVIDGETGYRVARNLEQIASAIRSIADPAIRNGFAAALQHKPVRRPTDSAAAILEVLRKTGSKPRRWVA